MAAIGAACTRCTAPYLYRDPVVRTGETCCASVMTEYGKRGKKKQKNILSSTCVWELDAADSEQRKLFTVSAGTSKLASSASIIFNYILN